MSKIQISPNPSGAGVVTLAAPNTASNVTLTLPAVTAELITNSSGVLNIGSGQLVKDAAGNLGLGVTPSAWGTDRKAIQLGSGSSVNGSAATPSFMEVASNMYVDGVGDKYITSNDAAKYRQVSGAHQWFTAPSGTAGNTISFTQAMTLSAAGQLLVGTTSVTTSSSQSGEIYSTGSVGFLLTNTTAGNFALSVKNEGTSGTRNLINFYEGTGGGSARANFSIDTSNNFAISSANATTFSTASVERARLETSGRFGVFVTDNDGLQVSSNAAPGTSWANFVGRHSGAAPLGGTASFAVYNNGNVVNTNNSYGALSDLKLKENIVDATPKLEKLNQVRIVNYNIIGDTQKQLGVIAQELEQIFPGMVDEITDRDSEGKALETTTKSVKYSVFVPMLIKAIQELTARLEVLENK
jgi:hypothetical protein